MKLELKHLAPYLPYKLKGKLENEDYYPTTIGELYRLETSADSDNIPYCIVDVYEGEIVDFKPILRPLSDLTKEIEVNGDKFIPHIKLGGRPNLKDYDIEYLSKNIDNMSYGLVSKLIEWHFDVFGLIEKGLAIDINTLPQSSE